jgi:glycosyltransferase involved in cell wall biosynthesis
VGGAWDGDPEGRPEGATGLFTAEQTPEALAAAIRAVEADPGRFSPEACRRRAEQFSEAQFKERILEVLSGVPGAAS